MPLSIFRILLKLSDKYFLHCEEGLIKNKSSADTEKGIIKKIKIKK